MFLKTYDLVEGVRGGGGYRYKVSGGKVIGQKKLCLKNFLWEILKCFNRPFIRIAKMKSQI